MFMRLKNSTESISTSKVKAFYEQRASIYDGHNRSNITMLQDKNPQLSEQHSDAETSKLIPKMRLDEDSCVLDLACGSGRWLDYMPDAIAKYRGIDFSAGMINIARSLNTRDNAKFLTGSMLEADKLLADEKGSFNRVMIIASLMYINDSDIISLFRMLTEIMTQKGGLICIKVSVGIGDRLTLKDYYSDELQSDYSAIYRTRDEYMDIFAQSLAPVGFSVTDEGSMFDESLNNRQETIQYYFILER